MADGISIGELPAVYQAIAAVMKDVGQEGIAKGRRNQQQGYSFRGIDDVYNALAPILARHHLIIVPRVLTREKTEQVTQKGGILFYVVVQVEFDIVCATDGSKITACTWGEAMDSADKATNKAMSAAYKYMAMQTFCIPTEGDNDADEHHHEVRANAAPSRPPVRSQQEAGADARPPASAPVNQRTTPDVSATKIAHQMTRAIKDGKEPGLETPDMRKARLAQEGDESFAALLEDMRRQTSTRDLKAWGAMIAGKPNTMSDEQKAQMQGAYKDLMNGLREQEEYAARVAAEADEQFMERA